jgi:hypothetical protein
VHADHRPTSFIRCCTCLDGRMVAYVFVVWISEPMYHMDPVSQFFGVGLLAVSA